MITTDPIGAWDEVLICPVCTGKLYTEIGTHLDTDKKGMADWLDQCPHCLSTFHIHLEHYAAEISMHTIRNSGQPWKHNEPGELIY